MLFPVSLVLRSSSKSVPSLPLPVFAYIQPDPYSASCKYCHWKLHAHKKGLLTHAKSIRHQKLVEGNFSDPCGVRTTRNIQKAKRFNDNWLKESIFQPGGSELVIHSLVSKHKKAISESFNQDLIENDLSWLSPDFKRFVMYTPNEQLGDSSAHSSHSSPSDGLSLNEIVGHLNSMAPLHLAESWDNVGLLVKPSKPLNINSLLITNDLTEKVMEEAIEQKVNLIISYHPPIFKPLKRLVGGSWKESIITSCIESGIALYSPHTALDAIKGGINDWLVESFGELNEVNPITQSICNPSDLNNFTNRLDFISGIQLTSELSRIDNIVVAIKSPENESGCFDVRVCCNDDTLPRVYQVINQHPSQVYPRLTKLALAPMPGVGMGRVGKLNTEITIQESIDKIKLQTGIKHVRLALGPKHSLGSKVSSFAVCAGSGFSLVSQVKADVIVTGEMSHHEILDCVHRGSTVILTEHSNSERGYLRTTYATNLKLILGPSINVITSTADSDPLKIA